MASDIFSIVGGMKALNMLQCYCQSMLLSYVIDERQLMFFSNLKRTDNVVLRTLMCISMVKYEMLGLAAKYGMRDVRGGLSAIKETFLVLLCIESTDLGF